jgi:hypothetical protein
MAALEVRAIDQRPQTPDERISPKVIFWRLSPGMVAHDFADRAVQEAASNGGLQRAPISARIREARRWRLDSSFRK